MLIWAFAPLSVAQSDETLTVCVDPDWMPYEALRNGKHVGIAADYMQLIERYSGIALTLLPTESWDETLQRLRAGDCEMVSMINRTPSREAYLDFSIPYFDSANVFVSRSSIPFVTGYDNIGKLKLGIVRNYRHAEYVSRYYPDINVTLVDSEDAGMLALAAGEIDIFVGSQLSVTAHIQKYGRRDLKIAGLARPYDKLSVGLIKSKRHLLSRINRAIESIPESQNVEIFRRWNNIQVIDEIDYRILLGTAAGFLVLLGAVMWRNYFVEKYNRTLVEKNAQLENLQARLIEQNTKLEYLSRHDSLTGLYNRHHMMKCCEDEIARMHRNGSHACLVIFDIDHFKKVNDEFGHSLGDQALVQISTLVTEMIRDIDVVARWGGEEFLLLCPETTLEEVHRVVDRLIQAIQHLHVEQIGHLTCSFGIAEYRNNDTLSSWFERADQALYRAKELGRNQSVVAQ
jgi:diguanylate cyclase (GGDEF)-like protein